MANENVYTPEGTRIGTAGNREYTASLAGLERAMQTGRILEGMAVVCDGSLCLQVDLGGVNAVIPREEAALVQPGGELKDIAVITRVGKAVCFKILNIVYDGGIPTVICSRRAAQLECMTNYVMTLLPGDVIPAKITHMEHFGAFVDIGCGIISLLSIDCISVSRISHPKDRFTTGMYIKTAVKSIDYDTGRVYVTHKELLGTWAENAALFEAGQTVAGVVRSIEDYGIFVELTPNLAGLAEFRDDITVGQTAAVYIKSITPERMKLKLVLIDSYRGELTPRKMDYYVTSGRLTRWLYSPPSCEKRIESVFE